MNKLTAYIMALGATLASCTDKTYTLTSPDGALAVKVDVDKEIKWSVSADGKEILAPSAISMTLSDGEQWGKDARLQGTQSYELTGETETPVYKRSKVEWKANVLKLDFEGGYSVEFRAFDDGIAYRFSSAKDKPYTVADEQAEFIFPSEYKAFVPYVNDNRSGERYSYSFESYYDEQKLSEMYPDSLAITPLLIDEGELKVAISDFANYDYPGMFVKYNGTNGLVAEFAPVPLEGIMAGYNTLNYIPTKRAGYIAADVDGTRSFPWRAIIVARDDAQLANSDMAVKLGEPSRIGDTSWIKPGKVAWDWWNNLNITGVDFKVGRNTRTYKYYIDFAKANGLEYIIVDEGWSDSNSIMQTVGDIDIPALVAYGKEKGVGVILWASWKNVHKELDEAMQKYADMGVAGFKIDFFDADDQNMIKDMVRFADAAARHHLVVDYHGMKANGLQTMYPNILNFEGVKGLENYRWSSVENNPPRYAVTAPFIRTLVGPMDYTPGAMTNATEATHHADGENPMSESTRAHQLAMYVVYDAPLQMLADSPSRYMANQQCTDVIAQIPTVFDETMVLDGKVGEYIVTARNKDGVWYVGAMTDRTPRTLEIDLSFLPEGEYTMQCVADGDDAATDATSHRHETLTVNNKTKMDINLAPAGGWIAVISDGR